MWLHKSIDSAPGARLTTDVICMHMRLLTKVADSEEKHEWTENSTQQLKELEDTSEFVYLLSSSISLFVTLVNRHY